MIPEKGKQKPISFDNLSSGEKQLIYSVSSILYHLTNLDSVSSNKIKYRYINLVLEEIELYFHPEYQKKYIQYLLQSIERIDLRNIEAINILLATHSPFILSDIPKQNVLFLSVNDLGFSQPEDFLEMKSFGANITDLLAHSFFICDGLVGNFAKDKIEKTVSWIFDLYDQKRKNSEKKSFKMPATPEDIKLCHFQTINIIDEPIVRGKLLEIYFYVFPDEQAKEKEFLELQRKAALFGYTLTQQKKTD